MVNKQQAWSWHTSAQCQEFHRYLFFIENDTALAFSETVACERAVHICEHWARRHKALNPPPSSGSTLCKRSMRSSSLAAQTFTSNNVKLSEIKPSTMLLSDRCQVGYSTFTQKSYIFKTFLLAKGYFWFFFFFCSAHIPTQSLKKINK